MEQTLPESASARRKAFPGVALVGFMGAGKTSVGRELASQLGWRFADLDHLIEKQERRTVEQIFREEGELAFRRLECKAVRDAIEGRRADPVVLALGGGAFIESDVQDYLREAGLPTVFLDAPVAELFRRCEQPEVERPLRRNERQFRKLYEQRRPQYEKALLHVDTSAKPVAEIAREIMWALGLVSISGEDR